MEAVFLVSSAVFTSNSNLFTTLFKQKMAQNWKRLSVMDIFLKKFLGSQMADFTEKGVPSVIKKMQEMRVQSLQ